METEVLQATSNRGPNVAIQEPAFTIFPRLPTELRLQIYILSLQPRIIRWIRKDEMNVFVAPSKSLPLLEACRESRETALLYGSYKKLPGPKGNIWFSPMVDFLFFDPGWKDLVPKPHVTLPTNLLESLEVLPELQDVRNVMVHPNYTDDRKKPSASFERLHSLERILVAADEKSIGIQSKFMLGTIYDMHLYYYAQLKRQNPDVKIPYIAVGCLGWVGDERRTMHHGDEDKRQLVAICDTHAQMMAHLNSVREEQWNFIQARRADPKLVMNLHWRQGAGVEDQPMISKTHPTTVDLPSYSNAIAPKSGWETAEPRHSIVHRILQKVKGWSSLRKWRQKLVHH
jgi:hypothetical protein